MTPTRRDLAWTLAAVGLAPGALHAQAIRPIVIADQGSAGEGPIASRSSYEAAIAEGADFLAAELVPSSDGILVARPENELSLATDVAQRPEFASRHKTATIDGASLTGWFAEDFTLQELKSLICTGGNRVATSRHPAPPPPDILTFQEVINIARAGSVRTARIVGVWANLRHPAYFAGIDLPLEARAAEVVRSNGYNSAAAAMFVGASEAEALKSLATLTQARLVRRLRGAEATPNLAEIRAYASGVCVDANRSLPTPGGTPGNPPDFPPGDAHAAGLTVYARAEESADSGNPRRWLRDLFVAGCDGVACRTPAQAVKARMDAASALRRQSRSA